MSVELPKDVEGREIPLDTTTLYDEYARPIKVCSFQYSPEFKRWLVRGWFNAAEISSRVSKYYLTPPDSWERLLEDLDKAASKTYCGDCAYFGKNPADCDMCTIGDVTSCDSAAMRDIADRIRKLRGEGDA